MNKRASAVDLIVIISILLSISFLFFIVKFSATTVVAQIVSIPQINQSAGAKEAFESIGTTTDRLDYLFLGVFIAFFLALIITSWMLGGETIFIIFYFLVAVISVIASMIGANVWNNITNLTLFGATLNSLPITNHILTNLPIYISIMAIVGVIVMFSKSFLKRAV